MAVTGAQEPVIAVLPSAVIDQIAAGEVIERPASVVKELVDNAIDAGARTITIETTGGGRMMIRVADDGIGMSPASAVLALERHATSKLRDVNDLWSLQSMGFRGEALPSIASVSRMTMTTRRASDLAATRVIVEASRIVEVTEVGAPVGTTVEVCDLLANLPVRLKFLKSDSTEATHVTDVCARIAMAHPALHLRLEHNGRSALELPADRDQFARVQALLGARIASRMVAASGHEGGIRIHAFLGAPELAQATARGVQIFLGKRPIRDRGLLHAIAMGYGELVPRGRYPLAVLLVDVPAGAVDINVHPQKHEVRFSEPTEVAAAVRHVVQAGVASAAWRAELGPNVPILTSIAAPRLPIDDVPATALSQRYAQQLRHLASPSQSTLFDGPSSTRAWTESIQRQTRASRAAERAEMREVDRGDRAERTEPTEDGDDRTGRAPIADGSGPVSSAFFGSLRYLGQLDLTYLACDGDGELVLIDQHSAHERVELERLRARGDRDVPVQKLLFPTTLDATPEELALVARPLLQQALSRVGFEVEPFGANALALRAVPAGIRHGDPTQLLRKLLTEWGAEGAPSEEERVDRMLAELACHSVVRAGDRLSQNEAESLLRELDTVEQAAVGPHGRPILLRLPLAEIARRFGR
ncbi:MAG: DNA mismatch repair endonuclease MutL [Kofleriaceae bacterium]